MKKNELVKFLDEYLKIDQYEDSSKNGLQVDNEKKDIKKIWYAVDATSYIFDKAVKENVDMVICHHGMFWWFDTVVVWPHYDRLNKLIKNDIALYVCHLPLDGHEKVGNNKMLLDKFVDFFKIKDFDVEQFDYSFGLKLKNWIKFEDLEKYCDEIWLEKWLYNFGNLEKISSIYFSSGGGLFLAKKTKDIWYDLLITWEWAHYEISLAKDMWQSVLLGWHYETEVFGVQSLSEKLEKDFWVEVVFLDEKY